MEIKNIKVSEEMKKILGEAFQKYLKEKYKINIKNEDVLRFIELNKDKNEKFIRNILVFMGNHIFRKNKITIDNKTYDNFFAYLYELDNGNWKDFFLFALEDVNHPRINLKAIYETLEKDNIAGVSFNNFVLSIPDENGVIQEHKIKRFKLDEDFVRIFVEKLKDFYIKIGGKVWVKEILVDPEDPLSVLLGLKVKEEIEKGENIPVITDIRTLNEIKAVKDKNKRPIFTILLPTKNGKILEDKLKISEIEKIVNKNTSLKDLLPELTTITGKIEELNYLISYWYLNRNKLQKKKYKWVKELEEIMDGFEIIELKSDRKNRNLLFEEVDKIRKRLEKEKKPLIFFGPATVGKDTVLQILKTLIQNPDLILKGLDFNKAEEKILGVSKKENLAELEKDLAARLLLKIEPLRKLYEEKIEERLKNNPNFRPS